MHQQADLPATIIQSDESEEDAASAAPFEANASGDLDACDVRVSNIPEAGLGLFATRRIKRVSVSPNSVTMSLALKKPV